MTKTDLFQDYISAQGTADRLAYNYFEWVVNDLICALAEEIADEVQDDCDFDDLSSVEEKTAEVANDRALHELIDGHEAVTYNARARAIVTGYEDGKDHTAWDRFQEEFAYSPEGWRVDNVLAYACLNWEIQERMDEVAMAIIDIVAAGS
jgi:hypothetical protein